jgi:hypothetical protein
MNMMQNLNCIFHKRAISKKENDPYSHSIIKGSFLHNLLVVQFWFGLAVL